MSPSPSDARIVSREALDPKDAKWTRLMLTTYADPNGKKRLWECAERQTRPANSEVDGVGIVAILDRASGPELLLQKQFRPPAGRVCIEVPAGLVDPEEGVEKCAVRELKEETGYVGRVLDKDSEGGRNWAVSPVMWNDPGFCNTNLNMVHVSVDMSLPENQHPKADLEDAEFIECFSVPLKDLYEECRRLDEQGYGIDARVGTLAEGIEMAKRWKL